MSTPLPRWVLLWEHRHEAEPHPDATPPAFVQEPDVWQPEVTAIAKAVTAQARWHDRALRWVIAHGYTYGQWLLARDFAQGTQPDQCAAVAITDGNLIALTQHDLNQSRNGVGGG